MNVRTLRYLGYLILGCCLISATAVSAETYTMNFRITEYGVTRSQIQAGDQEGHTIGAAEKRGLAFFENGEVATYRGWETHDSDSRKRNISFQGYSELTFEDGSTVMFKLRGTKTSQLPWWFVHGRVKPTGSGEFVKGSGRFRGIRGNLSFSGRGLTAYSKQIGTRGDLYLDVTATYTVAPR